jgi:hypothetical protein
MANAGNLRPFPKGVSGNPGGRPKFAEISEAYRRLLLESAADLRRRQPTTTAEGLALSILRRAVRGDVNAAREVTDRVEGRVPQAHEISGSGGESSLVGEALRQRVDELIAKRK